MKQESSERMGARKLQCSRIVHPNNVGHAAWSSIPLSHIQLKTNGISPLVSVGIAILVLFATGCGGGGVNLPDFPKIAFQTDRDGNWEIYVMNSDGSNPVNLTNNPNADIDPAWSPDGRRIAFSSDRESPSSYSFYDIFVMDENGSNIANLTMSSYVDDFAPDWRRDGAKITFSSGYYSHEIYVMDTDGSNLTRLTFSDNDDRWPTWSPSGTKIAWSFIPDSSWEVYVMNLDGTNKVNITNFLGNDWHPAWSPDGTKIAFASNRDGNWEIYVMYADGNSQVNLTKNPRVG